MPSVTLRYANCVGRKAHSVRSVILSELSKGASTIKSLTDSVMSAKIVENASMI